MNEEELFAVHERSCIQCSINALESVNKMQLPKIIAISEDSFSGLGFKTSRQACKYLKSLRDKHGDDLPFLIGLSVRQAWFALFKDSGYIALMMAEKAMGNGDYMQKLATVEGYGEIEGIARTLYDNLSQLDEDKQQAALRDETPFKLRQSLMDILEGAALYWFATAAISRRAGDIDDALDWLNEASDALLLAHGEIMFDASVDEVGDATAARTALGKTGARARHTENRAMKTDVFAWLDTNMPNFKSMDAAAQAAIKQQPIAFRTARDWIGQWKKVRSTGTP
jgi:hypothetical protein